MHIHNRCPHTVLWRSEGLKKSASPYLQCFFSSEGNIIVKLGGYACSRENGVNHGTEHGSAEGQRQRAMHEISSLIFL